MKGWEVHGQQIRAHVRIAGVLYRRSFPLGTPPEAIAAWRAIFRAVAQQTARAGQAPRGTLVHHYVADENGIITDVNLVVGTTNNNAPINMSVQTVGPRAAQTLQQLRAERIGLHRVGLLSVD